jgi:hypothetical protein
MARAVVRASKTEERFITGKVTWRPRTDSGTQQQRSVLDWYLEVG